MLTDEQQRLIGVTRALALAILACLAFSWRLWLARPLYPMAPIASWVPQFAPPADRLFLGLLVGLLLGLLVRPQSRLLAGLILTAFGILFSQDQSRLWPSFYQFWLLLLLLAASRSGDAPADARRILAGMRFVLAAAYFWAGVHKLNLHFFTEEFPWFVAPLTDLLPVEVPGLPLLGAAAAVMEILIGVGLLTDRFRRLALYDALAMHAVILVCIGPLRDNWNNSSWIWGLTTGILAWMLFRQAPPFALGAMFSARWQRTLPQTLVLLLVGILPVLNGVNCWDSALSFNVYTGNVHYAEIHLTPGSTQYLPEQLVPFIKKGPQAEVLDLNAWSLAEFRANAYPETRVFRAVFATVCGYVPPESADLYVREKAGWFFPKEVHRYRGVEPAAHQTGWSPIQEGRSRGGEP